MYCEDKPIVKLIELDLSELLVNQLEEKFGDSTLMYPQGFKRKVQVPISFANQLYAFYIESIYEQMEETFGDEKVEELIAQDEEFAKSLYGDKVEDPTIPSTSSAVMTKNRKGKKAKNKQVKEYKAIIPNELAIEMAYDKLSENFPSTDKESLMQVLKAYNNNYEETVNVLLNDSYTISNNIADVQKPPLSDELLKQIQDDFMEYKHEMLTKPVTGEDYRDEGNKYLKNREKLYQRANYFKQKGLMKVAQFYSNLATKQTLYYEHASARAVIAFTKANSKRTETNNTVNLHFLRLKEAQTTVDIFLDENINYLRQDDSKTKNVLQIVTGRGKHSQGGKPVLRPAIQSQLKKRRLKFNLLNEGMLRVKITKDSKLTMELL